MALLPTGILQQVKSNASGVVDTIMQGTGAAGEFIRKNPVTSAVSIAGGLAAGGTIIQIARKAKSKSKSTKKKTSTKRKTSTKKRKATHTKRGWKLDRAKQSQEKHEVAYRRRKRNAKKSKPKKKPGIYKTKTGQPYRIMANGKAKFIKKGGRK